MSAATIVYLGGSYKLLVILTPIYQLQHPRVCYFTRFRVLYVVLTPIFKLLHPRVCRLHAFVYIVPRRLKSGNDTNVVGGDNQTITFSDF